MFNSKSLLASVLVALLSLASAVPTNATDDAAAGVRPAPEIGTVFAVYPGWDMQSGPIMGSSAGVTELACMRSCSNSSTCVSYSYVAFGGNDGSPEASCFLKSAFDFSAIKIRPFDVSVGLIGACGTFALVGPTNCFTVTVPA
ncbi:hypothetical protein B0H13DRAFT_2655684 [Mycena leptocephala]|nr:hypothetical protein B0H13DRAFT_2540440 [Mycena leptocephala]KAJ7922444.1 hypothetical protein B0H13DRAFT_2655684 [Mycena leptocephala]